MSKNLINTVVSTVKNFISGGDTTPKMEIPDNSDFLKWIYSETDSNVEFRDKYYKELSIPALTAGERKVLSLNIGKLTRSDYVVWTSYFIDSEMQPNQLKVSKLNNSAIVVNSATGNGQVQSGICKSQYSVLIPHIPAGIKINDTEINEYFKGNDTEGSTSQFSLTKALGMSLTVTYDYKRCCRVKPYQFNKPSEGVDASGSITVFGNIDEYELLAKKPFTYENLGKGCIVGWYALAGTGVLGLNKKIILESSWLELLADGTTELKIALKNVDSTTSSAKSILLFVYNI